MPIKGLHFSVSICYLTPFRVKAIVKFLMKRICLLEQKN
ncbi:hypothetical protein BFV94_2622 [Alteromonas macleodii]|uniref:Uncharacterized protein n=1 Tax=Alteromonas macleodii TaxID=28108 RepID=A0AB36FX77_ALTMA|nr:hypothetical protein BFV95_2623 [Alteromonas macleodii]OES31528.1 hypothetical protein BFV94_2622 [Alteromonas macleodii]OES41078.1 hypothetical protein BFV96_2609 [Alteromonas macleodii]